MGFCSSAGLRFVIIISSYRSNIESHLTSTTSTVPTSSRTRKVVYILQFCKTIGDTVRARVRLTQNSKLKLFTKVQHQHLPSYAVVDEKMICFYHFHQNYLTAKWGIINHYMTKTPSELPTEVYWLKCKIFPKPGAHQSLVWVWLKYRNYNLSYSWLASPLHPNPSSHPLQVILESQSLITHQLPVSHSKADSRCGFS